MVLFSIWESDYRGNKSITLKRGNDQPCGANGSVIDEDDKKVLEFQASSWNEAFQIRNDHYGWGLYKPDTYWEEIGPEES
jgi:hypothetical protein